MDFRRNIIMIYEIHKTYFIIVYELLFHCLISSFFFQGKNWNISSKYGIFRKNKNTTVAHAQL